jgi:hypothetical protein
MANRAKYIDSLLPAYMYLAANTGQGYWQTRLDEGNAYAAGFWAEAHGDTRGPLAFAPTNQLRRFRQAADSWEAIALKVAKRLYRDDVAFRAIWQGPYRKF